MKKIISHGLIFGLVLSCITPVMQATPQTEKFERSNKKGAAVLEIGSGIAGIALTAGLLVMAQSQFGYSIVRAKTHQPDASLYFKGSILSTASAITMLGFSIVAIKNGIQKLRR